MNFQSFISTIQLNIFHKIFNGYNPRNEREFEDIIDDNIRDITEKYKEKYNLLKAAGLEEKIDIHIELGFTRENIVDELFLSIVNEKVDTSWKTYALWAFGSDATCCCICEDIPEHYIQCRTCNEIICIDCFENSILRGDSFYTINTNNEIYYCHECYTRIMFS